MGFTHNLNLIPFTEGVVTGNVNKVSAAVADSWAGLGPDYSPKLNTVPWGKALHLMLSGVPVYFTISQN